MGRLAASFPVLVLLSLHASAQESREQKIRLFEDFRPKPGSVLTESLEFRFRLEARRPVIDKLKGAVEIRTARKFVELEIRTTRTFGEAGAERIRIESCKLKEDDEPFTDAPFAGRTYRVERRRGAPPVLKDTETGKAPPDRDREDLEPLLGMIPWNLTVEGWSGFRPGAGVSKGDSWSLPAAPILKRLMGPLYPPEEAVAFEFENLQFKFKGLEGRQGKLFARVAGKTVARITGLGGDRLAKPIPATIEISILHVPDGSLPDCMIELRFQADVSPIDNDVARLKMEYWISSRTKLHRPGGVRPESGPGGLQAAPGEWLGMRFASAEDSRTVVLEAPADGVLRWEWQGPAAPVIEMQDGTPATAVRVGRGPVRLRIRPGRGIDHFPAELKLKPEFLEDPDPGEPENDGPSGAVALRVGELRSVTLRPSGDADWFVFTKAAEGRVAVLLQPDWPSVTAGIFREGKAVDASKPLPAGRYHLRIAATGRFWRGRLVLLDESESVLETREMPVPGLAFIETGGTSGPRYLRPGAPGRFTIATVPSDRDAITLLVKDAQGERQVLPGRPVEFQEGALLGVRAPTVQLVGLTISKGEAGNLLERAASILSAWRSPPPPPPRPSPREWTFEFTR